MGSMENDDIEIYKQQFQNNTCFSTKIICPKKHQEFKNILSWLYCNRNDNDFCVEALAIQAILCLNKDLNIDAFFPSVFKEYEKRGLDTFVYYELSYLKRKEDQVVPRVFSTADPIGSGGRFIVPIKDKEHDNETDSQKSQHINVSVPESENSQHINVSGPESEKSQHINVFGSESEMVHDHSSDVSNADQSVVPSVIDDKLVHSRKENEPTHMEKHFQKLEHINVSGAESQLDQEHQSVLSRTADPNGEIGNVVVTSKDKNQPGNEKESLKQQHINVLGAECQLDIIDQPTGSSAVDCCDKTGSDLTEASDGDGKEKEGIMINPTIERDPDSTIVRKGGSKRTTMKKSAQEHKKNTKYILQKGPICIENNGNYCYQNATFRFLQSIGPLLDIITEVFTLVIMNDRRPHVTLSQEEKTDLGVDILDLKNQTRSTIGRHLMPVTCAFVSLGNQIFIQSKLLKNMVKQKLEISLTNRPIIRKDLLKEVIKNVMDPELVSTDGSTQECANLYLSALLCLLRDEILTMSDQDIYDIFTFKTKEVRICVSCKKETMQGKIIHDPEPILHLSMESESQRKIRYGHDGHPVLLTTMIGDHFCDNENSDPRHTDGYLCQFCQEKKYRSKKIICRSPNFMMIHVKRAKRSIDKKGDSSKKSNLFIKDTTPVVVNDELEMLVMNENDSKVNGRRHKTKYRLKSAICHSSFHGSTEDGHYYVDQPMFCVPNINMMVSDEKIVAMTEYNHQNAVTKDSTMLLYEKILTSASPVPEFEERSFPCPPEDVIDALKNIPNSLWNKRVTRNSTQLISDQPQKTQRKLNFFSFLSTKNELASKPISKKNNQSKRSKTSNQTSLKVKKREMKTIVPRKSNRVRKEKKVSTSTYCSSYEDFVDPSFNRRQKRPAKEVIGRSPNTFSTKKKSRISGSGTKKSIPRNVSKVIEIEESNEPGVKNFTQQTIGIHELTCTNQSQSSSDSSQGNSEKADVIMSYEVVQSQRGLLSIPYDLTESDCLYCDVLTTCKISPATFVCEQCLLTHSISKSDMWEFYDGDKKKPNSSKCCVSCGKKSGGLMSPFHSLGQFQYCIDCIEKGLCKCIVCTSGIVIHRIIKEWISKKSSDIMTRVKDQPRYDPYVNFDRHKLTTRELDLLTAIVTYEKDQQTLLHSGDSWINMANIAKMLQVSENSAYFKVVHKSLALSQMSYYANIMANDSRAYIMSHFEAMGNDLAQSIQTFYNHCFFNSEKNEDTNKNESCFTKGHIFFLISLDVRGTHWVIGKFIKNNRTFEFISTHQDPEKTVNTVVNSLKNEWRTIYQEEDKLEITPQNMKYSDQNGCWPFTKDQFKTEIKKNSLYAMFLLRNWIYELSSDISKRNEDDMLTYLVLSGLHRRPRYHDDGELFFTYN